MNNLEQGFYMVGETGAVLSGKEILDMYADGEIEAKDLQEIYDNLIPVEKDENGEWKEWEPKN